MRSRLLLAALLIAIPSVATAQQSTDQKAVLATLDQFFDGMTRRDTTLSRTILLPGSVFYATVEGAKPTTHISSDSANIRSLATSKQVYRERIWDPTVLVHGAVAEVWTPYDFHVDGNFSIAVSTAFSL